MLLTIVNWLLNCYLAILSSELGVGLQTDGVEVRSVGNTITLHETALVEAFNLKAAIEYQLKNGTWKIFLKVTSRNAVICLFNLIDCCLLQKNNNIRRSAYSKLWSTGLCVIKYWYIPRYSWSTCIKLKINTY